MNTKLEQAQIDNYLAHYGVLGMKWGVRKQDDGSKAKTGSSSDNTTGYKPKNPGKESKTRRKKSKEPKHLRGEEVLNTKLDSGGSLTVRTSPPGPIAKALASKFKTIRELQEKVHDFTLSNEKNEKVGEASFTQTSKDTLELEWIGVRKAHRNRGYATAAMQGVIEYAKDNDITTLNLTATNMGSGIYESLGFKKVGESDHYDGLYQMTIPKRIKHSSSNDFELDPKLFGEYIKNSLNKNLSRKDDSESESIEHYGVLGKKFYEDKAKKVVETAMKTQIEQDQIDNYLAHYGVLGMKWGVRKAESRERIARGEHTSKPGKLRKAGKEENSSSPAKKTPSKVAEKPKVTRKEHRAKVKAEREKFYQDKAKYLLETAMKNSENLIIADYGDGWGLVVRTGEEFAKRLNSGGKFNVKTSDVFAIQTPQGYQLQERQVYRKPKR